jgi:hypothetical protein
VTESVEGWHFVEDSGRLRFGRRLIVKPGKIYRLPKKDKPILCESGFHASERAIDALGYAPGAIITRVILRGDIQRDKDKMVAREREVLWMADATTTQHEFSAYAADWLFDLLESKGYKIPKEFRACPEAKRAWLRGDITSAQLDAARDAARGAAWDTAWDTARGAVWGAARGAARGAAWGAARGAAWDTARGAVWGAARGAAWAAAWDTARDAAWGASRGAARGAARDAAWEAAWDAAWDTAWGAAESAARSELNEELTGMLMALAPVSEGVYD